MGEFICEIFYVDVLCKRGKAVVWSERILCNIMMICKITFGDMYHSLSGRCRDSVDISESDLRPGCREFERWPKRFSYVVWQDT